MAEPTQTFREIEVKSPLGKDALLFQKMDVYEALGKVSEMQLTVLSRNQQIQGPALIGQPFSIRLDLPLGQQRFFHGLCTEFRLTGSDLKFAVYELTLHPWLWFLGLRSNCRVFQEKCVPDIVKQLFREHGFSDIKDRLRESYPTRRYCVQYRESDLHFVQRLLEQEGIYYYFEYTEDQHVLVLADGISAHPPLPHGYASIPFRALGQRDTREEHVSIWCAGQQARPGKVQLNTFDFKKPNANLTGVALAPKLHAHADKEVYDYAGDYYDPAEGDRYARIRLDALQAGYEQARGQSNARGLLLGGLFTLKEHPRSDQNREYLLVGAHHHLRSDTFASQRSGHNEPVYLCDFQALDSKTVYRSLPHTDKPRMPGPETATVVGLAGQEIWTDKYGRIKIQFHWDREGRFNESSSCWVRVSQPWAGKGWGTVAIPRVGQEVLVDFLQGDPDRPVVVGRLFNELQPPPYRLPQAGHMMGFRSNSTPGGDGHCEMVIHDQKGQEKLVLHSQRDMETTVLNNDAQTIKGNRTIHCEGQHDEAVKGDINLGSSEKSIYLTARETIVLQAGESSLTLHRDGTIMISGPLGIHLNAET